MTRIFAPEFEAVTVRQRGWGEKENGELIRLAQREFDVLDTMDQSIPYQQNLEDVELVILLFRAPSNRLTDLTPLMPEAKEVLDGARPGDVLHVPASWLD